MKPEEIEKAIEKGIKSAIDTNAKDFYIGREEHYQHHQFIKSFIDLMQTSKKTAMRVIIGAVVVAVIALITFGFWEKIKDLVR